jgi:hypothetical protein
MMRVVKYIKIFSKNIVNAKLNLKYAEFLSLPLRIAGGLATRRRSIVSQIRLFRARIMPPYTGFGLVRLVTFSAEKKFAGMVNTGN